MVGQAAVLDAKARQRQVCAVQQGRALTAGLGDLLGQLAVLGGQFIGFILGPGFVQVGPHLAVRVLHVADALFQRGGGFVLQLGHRLGGGGLGGSGLVVTCL